MPSRRSKAYHTTKNPSNTLVYFIFLCLLIVSIGPDVSVCWGLVPLLANGKRHCRSVISTISPLWRRSVPLCLTSEPTSGESLSLDAVEETVVYYSPNVPLSAAADKEPLITSSHHDGGSSNARSTTTSTSPSIDPNFFSEYSFFDQALLRVRAGSGGQGSTAHRPRPGTAVGAAQQGPPDGGSGGRGGDVRLHVDASLNTLAGLSHAWRPNTFGGSGAAATTVGGSSSVKSFRAENGQDGQARCQSGRNGKDVVIRVPPGTVVEEVLDSGERVPLTTLILDVDDSDMEISPTDFIVARGGIGGEGTGVLLKSGRGVRRPRQGAMGGERKLLLLTLKIVADVALVAVPNAGKSTLLAAVTRAKPKIANYPFTTVIPNLGVWVPESSMHDDAFSSSGSDGLVLCDVPGLIAGASEGVGLGHAFLRHVERCHVILHLIDATSNDPVADYQMLNRELVNYGTGQLANMPQVVVVNKVDALNERGNAVEEWEEGLKAKWTRQMLEDELQAVVPHSRLMWISAKQSLGVQELMTRLAAFVKKVKNTPTESIGA